MNSLLVTGAAGFIGSNFVRAALGQGWRVTGLDSLTYAGHRENLEGLSGTFELIVEDIRSPRIGEILGELKPTAVLNFAAESHVDRSIDSPLLFVETNVLGTANLLAHSLQYWESAGRPDGFRFLQVSTDEVFGSLAEDGHFNEESPLDPSSPYSASKAGADLLVNAWHRTYGLPALVTRCSNNYGPYQFPEKLIPHMIRCALAGEPLPVYGNGLNVRDWIHVEDHCQGILLALEKGSAGASYCLGGGNELKNIELVRLLCRHLDRLRPRADGRSYSEQVTFVKDRPGHDLRYAIDGSQAGKLLGFSPSRNFERGLEETIHWYLANEEWVRKVSSG
jgi:dTDP-glucose 4,6-dehydratase